MRNSREVIGRVSTEDLRRPQLPKLETSSTTPDRGFPLTTTSDEATTETHSHAVLQTDRLNMIAQRVGVAAARGTFGRTARVRAITN